METKKKRFTLDLDPLVQKRLKVTAALKGMSMRQYCLDAIEKELAKDDVGGVRAQPFGEEVLDRLASLQNEIFQGQKVPGDSTDLIHEAREMRTGVQ